MNNSVSAAVFYNVWGHRVPNGISAYLESLTESVDVICLTEVTNMGCEYIPGPAVHISKDLAEPPSYINGFDKIQESVGSEYYIAYCTPREEDWECSITGDIYQSVGFGSAILTKKDLATVCIGSIRIAFDNSKTKDRILQFVVYDKGGIRYLVAHLHGVWLRHNTKGDDPLRDLQSEMILYHLGNLMKIFRAEKIVFGGDLNLAIDTRALLMLESGGEDKPQLRNLIRERGISNTRTSRYRKYDIPGEPKHADYAFVSPTVEVIDFTVRNDIDASDHAPLHVVFK